MRRQPPAPAQRHYGLSATSGRGLALVGALTRDWAVSAGIDGNTIWCVVPTEVVSMQIEPELGGLLTAQELAELGLS